MYVRHRFAAGGDGAVCACLRLVMSASLARIAHDHPPVTPDLRLNVFRSLQIAESLLPRPSLGRMLPAMLEVFSWCRRAGVFSLQVREHGDMHSRMRAHGDMHSRMRARVEQRRWYRRRWR